MTAYEVTINKKFHYIRLYNIKRSIKGGQNQISKLLTALADKYILKKKAADGEGPT
ncbi:MAG: hypothetical protein KGH64_01250 [Candidatus Micrarchaeota archaeon]|nr:hypothetical protein [Candidatus Micrarchaeota archaeon]MDE1833944.1 hypothetical protein [Candidatus Micrarchaeota archaeon]MDE1859661.1 hypothetical protein [Candidatus Micrarchaeota archaeon]